MKIKVIKKLLNDMKKSFVFSIGYFWGSVWKRFLFVTKKSEYFMYFCNRIRNPELPRNFCFVACNDLDV